MPRAKKSIMINDDKPNFYVSRGDASTLVFALEEYRRASAEAMQRAKKSRIQIPGEVASYAVAAADAQLLRHRVLRFMTERDWLKLKSETLRP